MAVVSKDRRNCLPNFPRRLPVRVPPTPATDSTGNQKKVDSRKLAASVKKVLSTPSYKENAERLRTKLLKYGGPAHAARLIEETLRNNRHQSFGR
jgi:hypothetical protein